MQIQNALLTGSTTVYGPITFVSGSIIGSSSYAATSSYADTFTVAGSLTAQTLVVQTITSSISFITGSTRFGSLQTNTHTFTGSLQVTGSGPHTLFGNVQMGNIASVLTATPVILSLGGTYSSTAGSNVKLRVYEEATAIGGMSVSSGQMEVNTWSSGKIAFYRGTTQTAVFDTSGNLGIATATPAKKLDVLGDIRLRTDATGLGPSLILNNGTEAANNYSQIAFGGTSFSTTYLKGGIAYVTVASGYGKGHMYFLQNSIDDSSNATLANAVMAITNTGSVGIGLTNPSSKLHVSGSGSGSLFQISSTVSSSIFFVSGSGNVGIGTTSPSTSTKLTISSTSQFGIDLSNSGTGGLSWQIGSTNDSYAAGGGRLIFTYNNLSSNSVLTLVQSSGNVGIGTTTPTAKLHISGSGSGSLMQISSTVSSSIFFVSGSGNVGIGTTSPSTKLEVNDTNGVPLRFGDISTSITGQTAGYIGMSTSAYSGNNGDLVLFPRTSATSNILLMSGSVGIGTTSPSAWNGNQGLLVSQTGTGNTNTIYSLQSAATSVDTGGILEGFSTNTTAGSKALGSIVFLRENTSTTALSSYTGFYTNNAGTVAERMRITSAGSVGIGTTSPGYNLEVYGTSNSVIAIRSGTTNSFRGITFLNGTSDSTEYAYIKYNATSGEMRYYANPAAFGGYTTFYSNNTESMRITSAGSVSIGSTSAAYNFNVYGASGADGWGGFFGGAGGTKGGIYLGNAGNQYGSLHFDNATNNVVLKQSYVSGTVNVIANTGGVTLANGGTSWAAISDRRKKKNFETTQGLAELLQIEPVKYHFEWDNDCVPKRMGFIAQNILPIIPEMVSKTSEIAEDGSSYLAITPDYILPVLTKAIQELSTKLDEATTRIKTLESR
jgi:hypothetical protein